VLFDLTLLRVYMIFENFNIVQFNYLNSIIIDFLSPFLYFMS